jgi:hypothetical protein
LEQPNPQKEKEDLKSGATDQDNDAADPRIDYAPSKRSFRNVINHLGQSFWAGGRLPWFTSSSKVFLRLNMWW